MQKVLQILTEIETVLGQMLDRGITEALIKVVHQQIGKARRWIKKQLRARLGAPNAETRKWVALALLLVQMAKAFIVARGD